MLPIFLKVNHFPLSLIRNLGYASFSNANDGVYFFKADIVFNVCSHDPIFVVL